MPKVLETSGPPDLAIGPLRASVLTVKTALIVLLVLLVLLTGLPMVGAAMDADLCLSCDLGASTVMAMCFALAAAFVLALPRLFTRLRMTVLAAPRFLLADALERPPRLP